MTEEKKEVKKPEVKKEKRQVRQIIIETDGDNINIAKNETAGTLELVSVLQSLLNFITKK